MEYHLEILGNESKITETKMLFQNINPRFYEPDVRFIEVRLSLNMRKKNNTIVVCNLFDH